LPLLIEGVAAVEVEGFWCRGKKTVAAMEVGSAYCSADRVDQAGDRVGCRVCEESD